MGKPKHPLRLFRERSDLTLDQLADRIAALTGFRPSKAKLSRIETGEQPVSADIIPALRTITGLGLEELRPDLAPASKEVAA